MKRIGLLLLAVVMVTGMAGCNGGDDFTPTTANMAGVYNLTKLTVTDGGATGTFVPPDLSGSINLTAAGTYTIDITFQGDRETDSGTFAIADDTIITDFGGGPITDDGRKFSLTVIEGSATGVFEFTRS